MFHEAPPQIIQKRMSFFSVLALSVTAFLITVVVSAAGIGIYSLRIVDRKADGLVGLVGEVAKNLPDLRDALPPALIDAMDDERRPDYLKQMAIQVRLVEDEDRPSRRRIIVEVENKGDEVVSMMTLRLIGMDKNGDPVTEHRTWVASPLQLDGDWRGPLLPHETRRFSIRCYDGDRLASMSHETTDIRLWCGYESDMQTDEPKEVTAKAHKVSRVVNRN
jgi:hypothetical protein